MGDDEHGEEEADCRGRVRLSHTRTFKTENISDVVVEGLVINP